MVKSGGEQDLLQHAKQATGEIVNQVQQQAGSQINRQKEAAANDLSHVVNAVRRFGETLAAEQADRLHATWQSMATKRLKTLNVCTLHSRAGSETTAQRRAKFWTPSAGVVARWGIPVGVRGRALDQEFDGGGNAALSTTLRSTNVTHADVPDRTFLRRDRPLPAI